MALVLVCAGGVTLLAQTADPFVGTWKLNLLKSSFPGPAPERPHVLSFEESSNGSVVGLFHELDDLGRRTAVAKIVFRYDGKDYQDSDAISGTPAQNSLAFTRVDGHTVDVLHKLNQGTRLFKERRTVSEDGQMMTFVLSVTDVGGHTASVVQVFDRQ